MDAGLFISLVVLVFVIVVVLLLYSSVKFKEEEQKRELDKFLQAQTGYLKKFGHFSVNLELDLYTALESWSIEQSSDDHARLIIRCNGNKVHLQNEGKMIHFMQGDSHIRKFLEKNYAKETTVSPA